MSKIDKQAAGTWCVFYVWGGKSTNPLAFRERDADGLPTEDSRRDFNEFIVTRKLQARGFDVWCGRKMEFIRAGKKRRAEPKVRPYLRNYIFVDVPPGRIFDVVSVQGIAPTHHYLTPHIVAELFRFREMVDTEYHEAERISLNREAVAVTGYEPGQALRYMSPGFEDALLRFRRIVEGASDLFPKIEAEMAAMGRTVRVKLDPLDVRAAE